MTDPNAKPAAVNPGIDANTANTAAAGPQPYNEPNFRQLGVIEMWAKYQGVLTWGKGQTLAILDDGCKLQDPAWQARLPWGPKVVATWNSIDLNDDCHPQGTGYHGTTVGMPSSIYLPHVHGIAYHNQVAHVRAITVVHLTKDESQTLARGLQWVRENAARLNITTVNLAPVDDQKHKEPWPSAIDAELDELKRMDIWVSAPAGNHNYTDGVSWPACQPGCFGIGAIRPGTHDVYLDRWNNLDLMVPAAATSSSNAYAAASAMILREAILLKNYPWRKLAPNMPDAIMAIMRQTGIPVHDPGTGFDFIELNLLAAVDHVMESR